jgi:glutaredoxin
MAKDITIYTTNTCAYCVMVKKYLAGKGLTYQEVNLDVPVTVVTKQDDTKEVVIGFNLAKLAPAVAS